jgi:hypothetical protein
MFFTVKKCKYAVTREMVILADNCWEMLFQAIRQLLGTAKWARRRKAARQCPKVIGYLWAIL